jgi:hypothetical protein
MLICDCDTPDFINTPDEFYFGKGEYKWIDSWNYELGSVWVCPSCRKQWMVATLSVPGYEQRNVWTEPLVKQI